MDEAFASLLIASWKIEEFSNEFRTGIKELMPEA